jgi:splicing factor 1
MIKVNDKVMIPQDDHPEINFVGLLIGPRGNTLKCKSRAASFPSNRIFCFLNNFISRKNYVLLYFLAMEAETGAKIIIRGKGSVKEGKVGRKDGQPLPGEDEPLHAYVTATNPEAVKKATEKIREIIREAVDVPEGQNDLRR